MFTKTSVVRCVEDQRARCGRRSRPTSRWLATAPSSSFGTSTARSISRRWPTSTMRCRGAEKVAHFFNRLHGGGEADALRPAVPPVSASRRASVERQMRAALVVGHGVDFVDDHGAGRSCSISRDLSAVSRMKSDSGVVTRMCGGFLSICWRSDAGVSPVRTAVRMGASGMPRRAASSAISARGISRLRWTSLESAFSGET